MPVRRPGMLSVGSNPQPPGLPRGCAHNPRPGGSFVPGLPCGGGRLVSSTPPPQVGTPWSTQCVAWGATDHWSVCAEAHVSNEIPLPSPLFYSPSGKGVGGLRTRLLRFARLGSLPPLVPCTGGVGLRGLTVSCAKHGYLCRWLCNPGNVIDALGHRSDGEFGWGGTPVT